MRIRFDRAGGGATALQMRRSVAVDTATLPREEAERIEQALAAAESSGTASGTGSARASGEFRYRIVIEDGGRERTIDVRDSDMPAGLRPVVDWLVRRAEQGGSR